MFKCIFKKHQAHKGIVIVVFSKRFGNVGLEFVVWHYVVVPITSDAVDKVAEQQIFWILV